MNSIILLCVSIFSSLTASILKKHYTLKLKGFIAPIIYNVFVSFIVCIFFLFFGINSVSVFTLLLSIAFSIVFIGSTFLSIIAYKIGPMSLSMVLISFSTVFTAISGTLFFGESITWSHIVGIVLMLICFAFIASKNENDKKTSLKWLITCIFASIFSGMFGILQKTHQFSQFKGELNEFLLLSFVFSTIISLILLLISCKKNNVKLNFSEIKQNKKPLIFLLVILLISGIATGVNHKLNLYLSGVFDSATFFPIINGSNLILCTLSALIIFKEKLLKKQWIGLIIGFISVIFLCNPF